jgi:hypothetical protein
LEIFPIAPNTATLKGYLFSKGETQQTVSSHYNAVSLLGGATKHFPQIGKAPNKKKSRNR